MPCPGVGGEQRRPIGGFADYESQNREFASRDGGTRRNVDFRPTKPQDLGGA